MRQLPHITCYIRAGSSWIYHEADYEHESISPNIILKPFVSPADLRECYARSRFIVVPIIPTTQWSAGCTTITMAHAMGRAAISTFNPGLGEYLMDGVTGQLVKARDPQAIAEAIQILWDNSTATEAMGHRARQWVEDEFSLDRWLDEAGKILTSE
jgi:glycosyltransferase involved in cell wall biosynthesis